MSDSTNDNHSLGKDVSTEMPTTDEDPTLQGPKNDPIGEIFDVLETINYPENTAGADNISNMLAVFDQMLKDLLPYHVLKEKDRKEIKEGLEDIADYLKKWEQNLQHLIDEREYARGDVLTFPTEIDPSEPLPGSSLRTALARWRDKMPAPSKEWPKEAKLMNLILQFFFTSVYEPYMTAYEAKLDSKGKSLEPDLSKVLTNMQDLCSVFSRLVSLTDELVAQYKAAVLLLRSTPAELRAPLHKWKATLKEVPEMIEELREERRVLREHNQKVQGYTNNNSEAMVAGTHETVQDPFGNASVVTARRISPTTEPDRNSSNSNTPRRFNHHGLKLTIPPTPPAFKMGTATQGTDPSESGLVTSPPDDGIEIDRLEDVVAKLHMSKKSETSEPASSPEEFVLLDDREELSGSSALVRPKDLDATSTDASKQHKMHLSLSSEVSEEAIEEPGEGGSAFTPPNAERAASISSDQSTPSSSFHRLIRKLTSSGGDTVGSPSPRRSSNTKRGVFHRKPTM